MSVKIDAHAIGEIPHKNNRRSIKKMDGRDSDRGAPDTKRPRLVGEDSGNSPTLSQLKDVMRNEINIVIHWYDIGLELLDKDGGILDLINDGSGNTEEYCTKMFKTWLNRKPNSSWSQLIVTLEKIKLNTAAEFVRRYSNGKSFPTLDIYQAMNVLPLIQEKWQLIGRNLGLSVDNLDQIFQEARVQKIPEESSNTFCCAKMLTCWFQSSSHVSADTIMGVISAPHVGLTKEKVSMIKAALTSYSFDSSNVTKEYATSPPKGHEQPYVEMKANVCKELIKSNCSIDDVLLYLETANVDPNVFKNISSFPNLCKSLEKHNHMNKADLSWLKAIAEYMKCEKALEIIENYEVLLVADKTNWDNILNKTNTGFIAKVSNNSLENCTIKDCSNAKLIGSKIFGLNKTDSILESVGVGSMIFYWRVKENTSITLPEVVNSSLMGSCKEAGVTHIGTIIDGNLQSRNIDELKIQDPTIAPAGMQSFHINPIYSGSQALPELSIFPVKPYSRAKQRTCGTSFTPQQLIELEAAFASTRNPNVSMRKELAKKLNLTQAKVRVWFRDRRDLCRRSYRAEKAKHMGGQSNNSSPGSTSGASAANSPTAYPRSIPSKIKPCSPILVSPRLLRSKTSPTTPHFFLPK